MLHLFISHSVIEENVEELVVEEVVLNNIKQKDDRDSDDMEVGIDLEDNFDEEEITDDEGKKAEPDDDEKLDPSFMLPGSSRKVKGLRNRFEYPELTGIFSRYSGVSYEAAFKVSNAFLNDIIANCPPEMKAELIKFLEAQRFSRFKLQNMVEKFGNKKVQEYFVPALFQALGIDGKEGPVRLKNNKFVRRDKQTVIDMLTGKLIDFFIPKNHSAVAIAAQLYELLVENGAVEIILSLNVDNEKKNTGRNNGLIRLLEIQLRRPISWIPCILHLVEVVFRWIFEVIDGKANGPQSYTGKIGKIVSDKDESWKRNTPGSCLKFFILLALIFYPDP